jgi:hypothetical protein
MIKKPKRNPLYTTIKVSTNTRRKLRVLGAQNDVTINDVIESLLVGAKEMKIIKHN